MPYKDPKSKAAKESNKRRREKYKKTHRDKIRKNHTKYTKNRLKTDPIYYQKHLSYCRLYRLKTYNLTLEEYMDLYEKQQGLCALCGQPEKLKQQGKITALCIDHDHQTGKVRGLLCRVCNRWVGLIEAVFNQTLPNNLVQRVLDYLG